MRQIQFAISLLLAGAATQVQARETSIKDTPVPISVFNADDFSKMTIDDVRGNLDRLTDIHRACVINRGDPIFGNNATGGIIDPVNIRGLESEYGTRYSAVVSTPSGQFINADTLKQIELLPGPNFLSCDAGTALETTDPTLAVQTLPFDVQSGRYLPRAADIRAELDSLVELCFDTTAENGGAIKERYEKTFNQLRELTAIRDDLRERLLTNDPALDREDALNQLKKLDPAIDGAVFPSQFKCPAEETFAEKVKRTTGHFRVFAIASETDFGASDTGIGFESNGTTETFAGNAREKVNSWGFGGGVTHELVQEVFGFGHLSYQTGDSRSDFLSPAGDGLSSGFVYDDRSPSGSTGLNIGDRVLDGYNQVDFDLYEAKFGISTPLTAKDAETRIDVFGFANAIFSRRDYYGEANADIFGQAHNQTRDQSLKDDYYGIGGGAKITAGVTDSLSFQLTAGGGVYYRETELDAQSTVNCPLCPAADQNFAINIREDEKDIAFALFGGLLIMFELVDRMNLYAEANYRYVNKSGSIFNVSSGNQLLTGERTGLRSNDVSQATVNFGIKFGF